MTTQPSFPAPSKTRKVLVTGAGVRVGSAIARAAAAAGHDVVLHANRHVAPAQALKAELEATGRRAWVVPGDLSTVAGVRAFGGEVVRAHPDVSAVVHNAALYERVAFEDITEAQYREMLALNIDAPFFLTQALLPVLRTQHDPVIVHIVDIGADRPPRGYAHYSVSKAGLQMLTRALAVELGPTVRVVGVSPGAVLLPEGTQESERQKILARVPLQREGTAEDVAAAVVFAMSQPYLNGCHIPVDGGRAAVY